jgi:hypothetical protein
MPKEHQDGVEQVWDNFFALRTKKLDQRFPGRYRAVVVETNDPLRMHRMRVRIPELHNHDLKIEHCPWAVVSPWFGGSGSGSWVSPAIDDIVWVEFEKGHPYVIVVIGFANPTRRKFYVLESVYGKTPLSVDPTGKPADTPDDFQQDYMPKDNRPMSLGWKDRYGSFMVMNSVGFFPKEHDLDPSPAGHDAVSKGKFDASKEKPKENDPDTKFVGFCTKYGHFMVMSDVGYKWKKDGNVGEFEGDFDKDHDWEIKRSKYLQRLFNEDKPKDRDQRRFEIRTRYGHKLEMRDVGWGQVVGSTRQDEYDDPRQVSDDQKKDQRWIKWRTKGGHLIEAWDFGSDPKDDLFVKRLLIDEVGGEVDKEDGWLKRGDVDARQIRIVTRYGFKFVLDDRGSDPKDATGQLAPAGNGLLIKGRRPIPEKDVARGFGIEFNEKDQINSFKVYSPKSKAFEINDKFDYIMLCTSMNGNISEEWQYLLDNEFARSQTMTFDPEKNTYHLKLDESNGYIRLMTKHQQGIEMRDGKTGSTWVEVKDWEDRGLWFTRDFSATILRSRAETKQYLVLDDGGGRILLHNGADGILQIYSHGPIQIKSDQDISLDGNNINLKAKSAINMEGGGGHAILTGGAFGTDVTAHHPTVLGFLPQAKPGDGAQSSSPRGCNPPGLSSISWNPLRPDAFDKDRGQVNQVKPDDFKAVDLKIIRGG